MVEAKQTKVLSRTYKGKVKTPKLFVRGAVQGYKRRRDYQDPNSSIVRLENVTDKSAAQWYVGKKVVYMYQGECKHGGPRTYKGLRAIWGKVCRTHGNVGAVIARFNKNLPPSAIGKHVRVFLYPSNI
jgi:large subunit ribosomal protein L35Ae